MAGEKMEKGLSFDYPDGLKVMIEGGGCKESYTALQNCKKEAEKNKEEPSIVECYKEDRILRKCMEAHSVYYQPILKVLDAADKQYDKEIISSKKEVLDCLIEGACKDTFLAVCDCLDEDEVCFRNTIKESFKCMKAHYDNYQPVLTLMNADDGEQFDKEMEASKTELAECLIGGACKDTIVAFCDCSAEDEDCSDSTEKEMLKCMSAHSDYYQPLLRPINSYVEYIDKELQALASKLSS